MNQTQMNKLILSLSLILFFQSPAGAQQVYKGGGTSNSTFLLGYASYARKSQCIFLPSDLTNAQSGTINRLYYKYGSTGTGSDQMLTNFNIMIGQTTATSFSGSYDFFTGLTPVMSSAFYTIPAGTAGNWFPIDLDVAFNYDASQTLIIQLSFDSSAIQSWGTYGTSNNPVKKIISPDVNATVGDGSSTTWQDMGFDLGPVGVESAMSKKLQFEISPNPANNFLIISLQNASPLKCNFQLSDITGRAVKYLPLTPGESHRIAMGDLIPGIYFATIRDEKQIITRKVIIE